MLALYRAGRQAEALDVYEAGGACCPRSSGIEPGERLRALHEAIVRQDPALGSAAGAPRAAPRRRRWVAARGAGAAAVAAAIASSSPRAAATTSAAAARSPTASCSIGPDGSASAAAALDGTPASITAADGHAWVLDADGQTVTEVDADGKRLRTFATGATPTDLTASRAGCGSRRAAPTGSQFPGRADDAVAHVDQRTARSCTRPTCRRARGQILAAQQRDRIAASGRAIWVLRNDGALVRIDPLSHQVVKVLRLDAVAVAGDAPMRPGCSRRDGSLVRVDEQREQRGRADRRRRHGRGPRSRRAAARSGSSTRAQGILERVRRSVDGTRAEPIDVGAGAGPVAYGDGTLWVAQPGAPERPARRRAASAGSSGEVRVGGDAARPRGRRPHGCG